MPTYRIIKSLCNYCNNCSNGFEIIDSQTMVIRSGSMSGLTLAFEPGTCMVTVNNRTNLCIDLGRDANAEWLMQVLMTNNIVTPLPPKGGVVEHLYPPVAHSSS